MKWHVVARPEVENDVIESGNEESEYFTLLYRVGAVVFALTATGGCG